MYVHVHTLNFFMHVHVLLVDLYIYIYINIRDNVETSQTFTNCTMKERIKCVAAEGPLLNQHYLQE
jgi:hypothetical protein